MLNLPLRRHRIDGRILVYFLITVGVLFGLGKLAGEVLEGDTFAIDRWLLQALRSAGDPAAPVAPSWVTQMMVDVTALGGTTALTLITVFAVGYLLVARHRGVALLLGGSIALGAIGNTVLKAIFSRARPDLVPHLIAVDSASFPSGHAMNSAMVYLTLAMLVGRAEDSRALRLYLLGCAMALTLVIGFSRVYLGVHWPSDVLAGWGVGALWAVLSTLGLKAFARRRPDLAGPAAR